MRQRHVSFVFFCVGLLAAALAYLLLANLLPRKSVPHNGPQNASAVDSPQYKRDIAELLRAPLVPGNSVTDYENGDEFFPAMLADIRAAQYSINIEIYIFRSSEVADQFIAALVERRRAGVRVHVIVDWIGARTDERIAGRLRAAGIAFAWFRPLRLGAIDQLNNRTHRKLLVVDGRIAYTGGAGIDDSWRGNGRHDDQHRDMMLRVEGPAAARMQGVFLENWSATTGRELIGPRYFPPPQTRGHITVQAFASSPEGGRQDMELMYLMSINGARTSIDLEASYFIPDKKVMQALKTALAWGVRIRIIMPGPHVAPAIGAASRARWGPLLAVGARLYRFQPAIFHNKLMIVDHYLTIAGSSNFDRRSFRLNDEADINLYDRSFAQHMTEVFERDLGVSREVTLQQWKSRPWTQKASETFWSLMTLQL